MEKPKKERTEAQKKATQSMLAKMKERREKGEKVGGRKKKEKPPQRSVSIELSSYSEPEPTPPKTEMVNTKPVPQPQESKPQNYLTKDDLHQFKNEIAFLLLPPPPLVLEKEIKRKPRVKNFKEEQTIEQPSQVIQNYKEPKPMKQTQPLTGYDLLDRLLKK